MKASINYSLKAGIGETENDAFDDFSDEDDDERMRQENIIGRLVLRTQLAVKGTVSAIDEKFGGRFFVIVCIVLYIAYFIWAMTYR